MMVQHNGLHASPSQAQVRACFRIHTFVSCQLEDTAVILTAPDGGVLTIHSSTLSMWCYTSNFNADTCYFDDITL